jgi:hypothetical protein
MAEMLHLFTEILHNYMNVYFTIGKNNMNVAP